MGVDSLYFQGLILSVATRFQLPLKSLQIKLCIDTSLEAGVSDLLQYQMLRIRGKMCSQNHKAKEVLPWMFSISASGKRAIIVMQSQITYSKALFTLFSTFKNFHSVWVQIETQLKFWKFCIVISFQQLYSRWVYVLNAFSTAPLVFMPNTMFKDWYFTFPVYFPPICFLFSQLSFHSSIIPSVFTKHKNKSMPTNQWMLNLYSILNFHLHLSGLFRTLG